MQGVGVGDGLSGVRKRNKTNGKITYSIKKKRVKTGWSVLECIKANLTSNTRHDVWEKLDKQVVLSYQFDKLVACIICCIKY